MTLKPPGAANRGSSDSNASDPAGILLFCCVTGVILAFLIAVAALLLIERMTSQMLLDANTGVGCALRFMLHADWVFFGVAIVAMVGALGGLVRGRPWLRDSEPGELLRVTGGLLAALGLVAVVIIAACLAGDAAIMRFAASANEPALQLSHVLTLWLLLCAAWLALVFALLLYFRR